MLMMFLPQFDFCCAITEQTWGKMESKYLTVIWNLFATYSKKSKIVFMVTSYMHYSLL